MGSKPERNVNGARRRAETQGPALSPFRHELTPAWQTEPTVSVLRQETARARAAAGAPKDALPFQLAPREFKRLDGESQTEWQVYAWELKSSRVARRPRGAGVTSFARRLMAIERARAQRGKPVEFSVRPQRRKPN